MASAPEPDGGASKGWGRRRSRHRPIPAVERSFSERLSILSVQILSYLAAVTPLRVSYAISDRVGDFLYWRSRKYRLNVIDNLRHVLGDRATEPELRRKALLTFRTSSRNFLDLMRTARLSREEFAASVRLATGSWTTLDRIRESGSGGIFITGHVGAFDSVIQILFVHGYDPFALGAPTVGKFVYAGALWLRSTHDARVEDVSPGAVRRMLRALKSGDFIGLVADRDFSDQGLPVSFFESQTTLPAGPARIARDHSVPIIPVFSERGPTHNGSRYLFHIEEPIFVPRTDDEEADLGCGIEQITRVLESRINQAPEQWVMFQRVWHDTPQRARRRRVRKLDASGNSQTEEAPGTRTP